MRAKRAAIQASLRGMTLRASEASPIRPTWPEHFQGVLLEPRPTNEELILDAILGGMDDLKSDRSDL